MLMAARWPCHHFALSLPRLVHPPVGHCRWQGTKGGALVPLFFSRDTRKGKDSETDRLWSALAVL
jgi:hypothetical protein